MLKRFVPVFSLAAMIGTAAFAQSPVAVTVNKAMLKVQQDPPPVTFTSPKTIVQLNCDGIDCAKLSSSEVTLESDVNAPKQRTFEFTDADFKQTKDVFIDSDETGNRRTVVKIHFTTAAPAATTDLNGNDANNVRNAICSAVPLHAYDEKENRAYFVVASDGSSLVRPERPIDENDVIVVQIVDDQNVVNDLRVVRKSATRVFTPRTVGSETQIARFAGKDVCKEFILGDFAPGEGQIEISSKKSGTVLGSFTFKVNTLYTGILSFGPVWSRQVNDQSFILVSRGDKKVIAPVEEGSRSIFYAVNYTYFWRGGRDLEKSPSDPLAHINPTIGIAMNSMSDHALVGLSFDVGDFLFTGGVHFAHQTRLSSASGLTPGSEFTGNASDIPTAKRWDGHAYFGVSINLRAAGELLKSITGSK